MLYQPQNQIKPVENNIAFIDAQNMHFGTTKCSDCAKRLNIDIKSIKLSDCNCGKAWEIDVSKFRIYLKDKYNVSEAYYFLGYLQGKNTDLYKEIQRAGFIVSFREHDELSKSTKKGNVDTEIVFEAMRTLIENKTFDKLVLVSGDGDYKKLVKYFIKNKRFKKILFPNKQFASSLYKEFGSEFFDHLENEDVKIKISRINKKDSLGN